MHPTLLMVLALCAGMLIPVQAGVNAALTRHLATAPLWGAWVNFAVGTCALTVLLVVMRQPIPEASRIAAVPVWAWTGGLMGMVLVGSSIIVGPVLGATVMITCIIAGQLLSSLLLDQIGFLDYPHHAISWPRLFGIGLLAAGAYLVQRY